MNIFEYFKNKIANEFDDITEWYDEIAIEYPNNPAHGDLSTNIAMILAKKLKTNPREIATNLIKKIKDYPEVESCNLAGPGFINIILEKKFFPKILDEILSAGLNFGKPQKIINDKINVEFVSVNPTGPMHIGHSRGAVYGDVLANLLKFCGYKVDKEYYINDAGNQINILANSAYLRYLEKLGQHVIIGEGLYPGEYLIDFAEQLVKQYGNSLIEKEKTEVIAIIKPQVINFIMDMIKNDLECMSVKHDIFFSEKTLHDNNKIDEAIKSLEKNNLIYKGILSPPKGKLPDDWEPREQILFKSTNFGDDIDRPIKKSSGEWTYLAADIAYCYDKICRGYKKLVFVMGADHAGYIKRIKAAVSALSDKKVECDVKIVQMVNFIENNQAVKMSKRTGKFITAHEVIEKVGKDVLRFIMLTRKNDAPLEFDINLALEASKDNPVFYVQYACARTNSIFNKAIEFFPEQKNLTDNKSRDLSLLKYQNDINLIKKLALWPKIIEQSSYHFEPHRIAFYLKDLAAEFHSFWNQGKEDNDSKFIYPDNIELTLARLALVKAVQNTLKTGLKIFGVEPLDKM